MRGDYLVLVDGVLVVNVMVSEFYVYCFVLVWVDFFNMFEVMENMNGFVFVVV